MAKTIGPAKIKKYCLEFKLKAVHLSDQPGVLIKDVAVGMGSETRPAVMTDGESGTFVSDKIERRGDRPANATFLFLRPERCALSFSINAPFRIQGR